MINTIYNIASYGAVTMMIILIWAMTIGLFYITIELVRNKDLGWIFTLFIGLFFLFGAIGVTLTPFN